MKTILLIVCVSTLLLLPACKPASTPAGGGNSSLTSHLWIVSLLTGAPPVQGTQLTAEFTSDGKASGSGGCNRFSTQYTASDNKIQIKTPMASTMMACPQPLMDQEKAYLTALGAAQTYTIHGDQMTLFDVAGKSVVVYQAQAQSLASTSWTTTGYNNGKQAVVSVINGIDLTASFGADGNLSGSSGCNTFSGPYTTTGNKIKIGPLAATRMFCDSPAGVMDQETQYLAALQSSATYKIEGTRLELRTADGALAADFQRK